MSPMAAKNLLTSLVFPGLLVFFMFTVAAAVGSVRTFFSALTVPEATIIGMALVTEPVADAESMNT